MQEAIALAIHFRSRASRQSKCRTSQITEILQQNFTSKSSTKANETPNHPIRNTINNQIRNRTPDQAKSAQNPPFSIPRNCLKAEKPEQTNELNQQKPKTHYNYTKRKNKLQKRKSKITYAEIVDRCEKYL